MTFRSPLRNEWERVKPAFEAAAKQPGRAGTVARVQLALMPGFVAAFEGERDLNTSPADFFDAVGAACGMMIEEAIDNSKSTHAPAQQLNRMLAMIDGVVRPRVTTVAKPKLILPGMI